jgi:hypothetical protein
MSQSKQNPNGKKRGRNEITSTDHFEE